MSVYIALLTLIFSAKLIFKETKYNKKKGNILFLKFIFFVIFLICIFRSSTVGRDLESYKAGYLLTEHVPFYDFSYIYFEKGYIFLMKLCSLLHFPFQLFLTIVYTAILFPLYLAIKKYSKNYFLSIIIFICYIYFEFTLTGVRQSISMAIVLYAYIIYIESNNYQIIKFLFLVFIASLFHKGALISVLFILLAGIKSMSMFVGIVISITSVSLVYRENIFLFIKNLFSKEAFQANATLYIGLNVIFLICLAIFFLFVYSRQVSEKNDNLIKLKNSTADKIFINIFLLGIMVAIFFGNETTARSYLYFSQVIIILLPNSISKLEQKSKSLVYILFICFFIVFFFTNTLLPNNFDIVPYKFFWE